MKGKIKLKDFLYRKLKPFSHRRYSILNEFEKLSIFYSRYCIIVFNNIDEEEIFIQVQRKETIESIRKENGRYALFQIINYITYAFILIYIFYFKQIKYYCSFIKKTVSQLSN